MIHKNDNRILKALVIKETFSGFHEVKIQTTLAIKKIIKSITNKNIPMNKCRRI